MSEAVALQTKITPPAPNHSTTDRQDERDPDIDYRADETLAAFRAIARPVAGTAFGDQYC